MSHPLSIGAPVTDLRPTQMTAGFREVRSSVDNGGQRITMRG
jgi:hypothetical protein